MTDADDKLSTPIAFNLLLFPLATLIPTIKRALFALLTIWPKQKTKHRHRLTIIAAAISAALDCMLQEVHEIKSFMFMGFIERVHEYSLNTMYLWSRQHELTLTDRYPMMIYHQIPPVMCIEYHFCPSFFNIYAREMTKSFGFECYCDDKNASKLYIAPSFPFVESFQFYLYLIPYLCLFVDFVLKWKPFFCAGHSLGNSVQRDNTLAFFTIVATIEYKWKCFIC